MFRFLSVFVLALVLVSAPAFSMTTGGAYYQSYAGGAAAQGSTAQAAVMASVYGMAANNGLDSSQLAATWSPDGNSVSVTLNGSLWNAWTMDQLTSNGLLSSYSSGAQVADGFDAGYSGGSGFVSVSGSALDAYSSSFASLGSTIKGYASASSSGGSGGSSGGSVDYSSVTSAADFSDALAALLLVFAALGLVFVVTKGSGLVMAAIKRG